jgi:hypothetical protein
MGQDGLEPGQQTLGTGDQGFKRSGHAASVEGDA